MRNNRTYETHDFYCINCGSKGIPLSRSLSRPKGKDHRKLMYCWKCKHTVNHIECLDAEEVEQFLADFNAGKYVEEAKEELKFEEDTPQLRTLI